METDLIHAAAAARLLGVARSTISDAVDRGRLKPAREWTEGGRRKWLFHPEDVEALRTTLRPNKRREQVDAA